MVFKIDIYDYNEEEKERGGKKEGRRESVCEVI
jgi:hypothetical protein